MDDRQWRVRAGLRVLRRDLAPGGQAPLFLPPPTRFPSTAWTAHLVVGAYAVLISAVAWHTLIEDYGLRNEMAGMLGAGQALALPMCLYRPMAGWWLSLASAALTAAIVHPGPGEAIWPTPCLAVHLSVLALIAFKARPRVLAEMWLITVAVGVVLVTVLPGGRELWALTDMTVLSAAALVAVGALRGRSEALRRVARAELASGQEQTRRAVLEERTRIARELHDVVAHHMSVVAVQAEAAPYRVADPPEELMRSFATIRTSALEALTELHRTLGLLRNGTSGQESGPQPTLEHLDGLVDRMREAGLDVALDTDGRRRALPAGVELSAYRIVQEALSNVLRHAPGATAHIEVIYRSAYLELHVTNSPPPIPPPASPGSGHGLLGMRERASMLGGRLSSGPRADGGYAVVARLPLEAGEDG
ncbi:sensor histidine kinase [Planomonospora venezuelensis]|uniref:histidine kinase n=1 Tax=Planomonospora venezuelensis TaxID=1999 RepID=A0A841DLG5_PLAVE|nr:histidine kinase [Planomonospora venezuelensis]MBB5967956.1 signal transduction histidine kinase [Planomonospora venezuelensis]GIN00385.1 two-component sensor histidine kinase [Planomonospora venezuelensis]